MITQVMSTDDAQNHDGKLLEGACVLPITIVAEDGTKSVQPDILVTFEETTEDQKPAPCSHDNAIGKEL